MVRRGAGGSETVDSHTSALAHGGGDVLDGGASATVEGDDVRLVAPLSTDDVRERDVAGLGLYDAAEALTDTAPVSAGGAGLMANKVGVHEGRLRYEQYLGRRPFHG